MHFGIPEDARQCAAVNDDIPDAIATSDALIEGVTVQPGEAITVVGTVFQFIGDDGTGAGGYLLVVAPSDL